MISRAADECFWLGRYLERAAATARLLAAVRTLALDDGLPGTEAWRAVLACTGQEDSFGRQVDRTALPDGEEVERSTTWDEENPGSILRSVGAARENARSARDLLTLEVWEALNGLHLWLPSSEARSDYQLNRFGFYMRVCAWTELVLGWTRSTMLQDAAVDFLWLGVMLERAGWTARWLDTRTGGPHQGVSRQELAGTAGGNVLLDACAGLEPFLRSSRGRFQPRSAAAFLLLETSFPRSVRAAVREARERIAAVRGTGEADPPGDLSAGRIAALDSWLADLRLDELGDDGYHRSLKQVARDADGVSDALTMELFGPATGLPPGPVAAEG